MTAFLTRIGATFFFTGHFPVAPATFASAVTLLLWRLLPSAPGWMLLAIVVFVVVAGVPLASRAERIYGHDGKPIVIDEVAGVLLTVAGLAHTWPVAIAGFLFFRVLDVAKPPPAYQLQSLPRGWGVMADDLAAGIYGNLLLRLAALFWPALAAAAGL